MKEQSDAQTHANRLYKVVVKHIHVESTCLETGWEDRALLVKQESSLRRALFLYASVLVWISREPPL